MTWLLALTGWGGAAGLAVALKMGLGLSRQALLICAAIAALAMAAWGLRGYRQAADVRGQLAQAQALTTERTAERDKARAERAAALDAADQCSRSVQALHDAAAQRERAAAPERQRAHTRAQRLQQRAAVTRHAPATVPGDDYASARQRADAWLRSRAEAGAAGQGGEL